MKNIERAIRDAVEKGGYKNDNPSPDHISYDKNMEISAEGLFACEIFLDPNFWQALGKAKQWGYTKGYLAGGGKDEWQEHWHDFIDHLADGKPAEAFFADLNSSQSI